MKKNIVIMLALAICMLSLTGCKSDTTEETSTKVNYLHGNDRFVYIDGDDYSSTGIFVDTETGVEYLHLKSHGSSPTESITVLVQANGTPISDPDYR